MLTKNLLNQMAQHNDLGKEGEKMAQAYLLKQGYKILATNWQFGHAEIDVLALKNDVLAVIEVKTRTSAKYGQPETFVSDKKKKLLMRAVNHYVEKYDLSVEIRFDIISIIKNKYTESLTHIEDAFYWY